MVKSVDKEVDELLKQYNVFEDAEYNKIRCKLTGHELPPRAKQLKEYIDTKKFQTAWKLHQIMEQHADVFEEIDEKLLGCKITKKVLARDPVDLLRHLEGKRFKKALARGVTGDEEEDENDSNEDDSDEAMSEEGESEEDEESADEQTDDYPELINGKAAQPADEDSYDFAVMDTEADGKGKKRKTEGKGVAKEKKKKRTA